MIEQLVGSIKIVENSSISNSVFNYLNIFAETEDIDLITQARQEVIQPKNTWEEPSKVKL